MDPLTLLGLVGALKGGGSTKVNTSTSQTSQVGANVSPAILVNIGGGSPSAPAGGAVTGGSPSSAATGAPQMDPISLWGGGLPSYATGGSPYPSSPYSSSTPLPMISDGGLFGGDMMPLLLIGGGVLAWMLFAKD